MFRLHHVEPDAAAGDLAHLDGGGKAGSEHQLVGTLVRRRLLFG